MKVPLLNDGGRKLGGEEWEGKARPSSGGPPPDDRLDHLETVWGGDGAWDQASLLDEGGWKLGRRGRPG